MHTPTLKKRKQMHMDAVFIQDGFLDLRLSDPGTSNIEVLLLGLCLTMRFSHRLVSTKHYSSQGEPPHGRQDGCQEPRSRKCPSLHINVRGEMIGPAQDHVPSPEPITMAVGGIGELAGLCHIPLGV